MDDMYPHMGPAEGKGIINFYGSGFRDDYPLADVGCKIGESIGKCKVISPGEMRCVVEEMETVDEGQRLTATIALNSYSWVEVNETGWYVPYGVEGIYPNSGPYVGGTDILVQGKGFDEELQEKARCRFGTDGDFSIVEAAVLSWDKIMCRSPPEFKIPSTADSQLSVPFGIAFGEEDFNPWTRGLHRYRMYNDPLIVRADPDEVEVGRIIETYLTGDELSEFWEPVPTSQQTLGMYGI